MPLNIVLQIDPPHTLKLDTDSSLIIGREALKRGHRLFYLPPESVCLKDQTVFGRLAPLAVADMGSTPAFTLGQGEMMNLSFMDVILIRQDPPVDMAYITNLLLLEQLDQKRTLVLNRPLSILQYPEKLLPFQFPEFMPPTLISRDTKQIHAFLDEHGDVVLKPLYAYGGKGIFKLSKHGENVEALLEMMLDASREPLVVQRFLPEVYQEEKRIILIDGKVAGALGRIPAEGDIRANMRVGGQPVKTSLTARQLAIAEAVGAFAKREGLMLVGLDVIGDWLTEVNITSPTGFGPLKTLYGLHPEADFWDAVEAKF